MLNEFSHCPLCKTEKHKSQLKKLSSGKILAVCKKCFGNLRAHVTRSNKRCRKKKIKGRIKAIDWALCLEHFGFRCIKCKKPYNKKYSGYLTIDHVVPTSRGGLNVASNIQPMCKSCNWEKGDSIADYRKSLPPAAPPIILTKPLTKHGVGHMLTSEVAEEACMTMISKLEKLYEAASQIYDEEVIISYGKESFPREQWYMKISVYNRHFSIEAPTLEEVFEKTFEDFGIQNEV